MFLFLFQLKAALLNSELQIVEEASVQFDSDLPEFRFVLAMHLTVN